MAEAGNGSPLTEWRNRLLTLDEGDSSVLALAGVLAEQLEEDLDPYATLRDLKLPVPQYVGFGSVSAFMEQPDQHLDALGNQGITNYYVGLRTGVEGWSKYRTPAPVGREDVVPYIAEHIPVDRRDQYALRVAEYVVAVAGVVMIINRPEVNPYDEAGSIGQTHVDIIGSDLGPLATGHASPDFRAITDNRGILRYYGRVKDPKKPDSPGIISDKPLTGPVDELSLIDTPMRTAIRRAINAVPTDYADTDQRVQKMPGYYEFAVVDHGGHLVPLFVDAKPSTKTNQAFNAANPRTQAGALRLAEAADQALRR